MSLRLRCLTLLLLGSAAAQAQETPAASEVAPTPSGLTLMGPVAPPPMRSVCDAAGDGMPTGPAARGLLFGDLARPWRACARSEVGADVGLGLLIDLPAFYGRLGAGLTVRGSWAPHHRVELFASLPVVRAEVLITPLASTAIGLGALTVGASWRGIDTERVGVTGLLRAALPTQAGLFRRNVPIGVEAALSAIARPHRRVGLHGGVGLLGTWTVGGAVTRQRAIGWAQGGLDLRVARPFSLVTDLVVQAGNAAPLDHVAGALGLRFSDGRRFGLHLDVTLPFAGVERTLAVVDLGVSVRLGPTREVVPQRGGRPVPASRQDRQARRDR